MTTFAYRFVLGPPGGLVRCPERGCVGEGGQRQVGPDHEAGALWRGSPHVFIARIPVVTGDPIRLCSLLQIRFYSMDEQSFVCGNRLYA